MEMSINLSEKQLQERIAAALKAEGFRVLDDFFHGVHFSYDNGDGPGRPGAGLSASVSATGSDALSLSVHLDADEIEECLAASLDADGYLLNAAGIYLHYDPSTGNQLDPGNGTTARVSIAYPPPPGAKPKAIGVAVGRVRRVSLHLNQPQIRKRISVALTGLGNHVPREDWISFSKSSGDRWESSTLRGSAIVRLPGNVEGTANLSQSDIEEMLTDALCGEGYAVEKKLLSLNYDAGGGNPCDQGNGLTASVRVKWPVGVTKA